VIAIDSNVWISFFAGDDLPEVEVLDRLLRDQQAVVPPVVLSEFWCSQGASAHKVKHFVKDMPLLEISEGYWQRAGLLRAQVLMRGAKAHTADALIAQSCIDHEVPLLTRDSDFRHFAKVGGLKLY
jgi:predicted nucleic acid-binding protein